MAYTPCKQEIQKAQQDLCSEECKAENDNCKNCDYRLNLWIEDIDKLEDNPDWIDLEEES